MGKELAAEQIDLDRPELFVHLEGTPRNLHPIVRDEIYRVATEALRNAFQHARARRIELELRYDQRQLRLRVRDDGKGFNPRVQSENRLVGPLGFERYARTRQTGGGSSGSLE